MVPPVAKIAAVLLLAVLCCALSVGAFAQDDGTVQVYSGPGAPSAPNPSERFTINGTVIDAATGEPVRKALVQVNSVPRRTTFSDSDGRFQLEGIPAGPVTLSVQKPGYFGDQELSPGGPPLVEVGPKASSIVVKLTPEAVISGKVTTAEGAPLEHVSMNLTYIDIHEGRRRWQTNSSVITDEDGRFRFANLRPGTYYVGAAPYTPLAETMLEGEQPPTTGFPGSYYPGVPDLASAAPIQLTAGQQAEANFSLHDVPVYSVSGMISGYAPNQGVAIQVFDQSGVQVPTGVQFSADNGRFDVHALAAGNYLLKVTSSMGPNQPVRAETRVNLSSNLYNLHIALAPELSIPVVVRLEPAASATQQTGARLRISPAGPPVSVRLIGSGPGANEAYASLDGPANQQSLVLRNVEPGRYSAVIDPRESWYVASADYGQTNLLADDLVIVPGAPPLPLNIVLRNDCASLGGLVHVPDGLVAPVYIVAVQDGVANASPRTTYFYPQRDKNPGAPEFFLDSLAPGDYLVFAFGRAEALEYSNPDVLQNYASQAARITLAPGRRAEVSLELIPAGEGAN